MDVFGLNLTLLGDLVLYERGEGDLERLRFLSDLGEYGDCLTGLLLPKTEDLEARSIIACCDLKDEASLAY